MMFTAYTHTHIRWCTHCLTRPRGDHKLTRSLSRIIVKVDVLEYAIILSCVSIVLGNKLHTWNLLCMYNVAVLLATNLKSFVVDNGYITTTAKLNAFLARKQAV